MAQQGRKPFTDEELAQFSADPDLTPDDLQLLSADERSRLQTVQASNTKMGHAKDVVTGVGKGAGETAFDLGRLVHKTPLIGKLTDTLSRTADELMGPQAYRIGQGKIDVGRVDPDAAFSKVPQELEATNAYQKGGKVAEQVGEFFVPAPSSRLAAVKGLVRLIPNAASPRAVALANKVLTYVGRVVGEAGSAGAVSAVHGDDTPETPAMVAGGTAAASEMIGPMVKGLLKTKLGGEIAPMLAAIAAMNLGGGVSTLGLGAGLGAYGIMKRTAASVLKNPKLQAQTARVVTKAGTKAGELAAGVESESRVPKRRRLRDAIAQGTP